MDSVVWRHITVTLKKKKILSIWVYPSWYNAVCYMREVKRGLKNDEYIIVLCCEVPVKPFSYWFRTN